MRLSVLSVAEMSDREVVTCDLVTMVSEAKELLMELFKNDNQQLWYVSYPPPRPDDSDEPRSPPSDKNYTVTQLSEVKPDFRACLLPVLEKVKDGLSALFSGKSKPVIYNKSFWMRYFQTLVFELSAGLVVKDHDRSEAEIIQQLGIKCTIRTKCATTSGSHTTARAYPA